MKVIDITSALEKRKRRGRWTATLDADGALVIAGHDDQGEEEMRLTWPEAEAAPVIDALYRLLQTRRFGAALVAHPAAQPRPVRPPRKWKRCGCTRDGWFTTRPSGCNRRRGHEGAAPKQARRRVRGSPTPRRAVTMVQELRAGLGAGRLDDGFESGRKQGD